MWLFAAVIVRAGKHLSATTDASWQVPNAFELRESADGTGPVANRVEPAATGR
jgi:hypothetical protein